VGLLQRACDYRGLATVSLTLVRELTELGKPSLACFAEHPFGLPIGTIGDKVGQRRLVETVLGHATMPHPAGTIVDLRSQLELELRERQLRHGG
jgi:hypothetical protein